MKKFGIRLPVLCALLLFVGVTALAVSQNVVFKSPDDEHVTVTLGRSESGDPTFTVTRDNATIGKRYLLVIRNGDEEDDPTEENIFYMDMQTAESSTVTFSNAYPMDMADGLYRVYMTDYTENKLKQVRTFEVSLSGDNGGDGDNGGADIGGGGTDNPANALQLGDVDGKDGVTPHDASLILQICAHKLTSCTEEQYAAADVDGKDGVTPHDASLILQKCAHKISAFPNGQ